MIVTVPALPVSKKETAWFDACPASFGAVIAAGLHGQPLAVLVTPTIRGTMPLVPCGWTNTANSVDALPGVILSGEIATVVELAIPGRTRLPRLMPMVLAGGVRPKVLAEGGRLSASLVLQRLQAGPGATMVMRRHQ